MLQDRSSSVECSCCREFSEEEAPEITDEDICYLSFQFPILVIYRYRLEEDMKFIEKLWAITVETDEPITCAEGEMKEPGLYQIEKGRIEKII